MNLRCSYSALNCRIVSITLPGNFLFLSNSQNPQFLGQHHLVNHNLEHLSLRFSGAANRAKTNKTWKENLLKLSYPQLSLRSILCKSSELVRNLHEPYHGKPQISKFFEYQLKSIVRLELRDLKNTHFNAKF